MANNRINPTDVASSAFQEALALHRRLNAALAAGDEPSGNSVGEFFQTASRAASEVQSSQDRDELRDLIQLWGSYLAARGLSIPLTDPEVTTPTPSHRTGLAAHQSRAGSEPGLHPEVLLLDHLGTIDRYAASACRRYGMWGADAEDFSAWVKMKMMEDDYAVLRKFRGDTDIKTYLAIVVARLCTAFARERRGRWRPSSAAVKSGSPAMELEMLVYRDGYTIAEAGEKLRSSGKTALSDVELARVLASIPERVPVRPIEVPADAILNAAESPLGADERVNASEKGAQRQRLMEALDRAMDRLSVEDRAIALMHFADGQTINNVARALQIEQKPLYRRVPKLREQLRRYLEDEGVSGDAVLSLLERENV